MSSHFIRHTELEALSDTARNLARLRKNLNVHTDLEASVQRLFNAMEPGTYIRPHRHARSNGWELMLAVRGRFAILVFDDEGCVLERFELAPDDGHAAVEIPANTWHTVVSLIPGTVMFEVKEGPYAPLEDKDFAAWAPNEGQALTASFREWFENAQPGEIAP